MSDDSNCLDSQAESGRAAKDDGRRYLSLPLDTL